MKHMYWPAALALLFFALPARAAIIGEFDLDNFQKLTSHESAEVQLSRVCGQALCPFETSIIMNGNNRGDIFQYGTNFYYTNLGGFYKKALRSFGTTGTLIKSGNRLETKTAFGNLVVVSDKTVNVDNARSSFIYNTTLRSLTNFSPRVGQIDDASWSGDRRMIALLAKNTDGVKKIFLSQGSLNAVKEFALPQYATNCYTLGLSPSGHTIFLGCDFQLPDQKHVTKGTAVMLYANGRLKLAQRLSTGQNEIDQAEWMSNNRLITLASNIDGSSTIQEVHVSDGKIIDKSSIIKSVGQTVGDSALFLDPYRIQARAAVFYYNLLFTLQASDGTVSSIGTTIGFYDTGNRDNFVVTNDQHFRFLIGH